MIRLYKKKGGDRGGDLEDASYTKMPCMLSKVKLQACAPIAPLRLDPVIAKCPGVTAQHQKTP